MHQFSGRLTSILDLKEKHPEEFKDELPETTDFKVGYFYGKQSAKRWIAIKEHLNLMYEGRKDNCCCGQMLQMKQVNQANEKV